MADGKFIVYFRVSTKKQGMSGLGLEAQQADVERYLNGGNWQLVGEFTDIESGTRKGNKRPELAKALLACKRQKATLVIAKLDRLARNVAFVSAIMESGVDFVCVDNPHATRLTIHILAAVAEEEARATSLRTKAALAAAKARGVKLGNSENLTHDARIQGAKKRFQGALEAYAKVSHLIVGLKGQGNSLAEVAQHLNDLGEVTVTGALFTPMTVKRILDRI
jgi:DNA invertase Pin-like site-specific DNA recombinase